MNKTRLDQFLVVQHPHYSRSQIKKLIDEGYVLVEGQKRKPSFILRGGENIEMVRRAPEIPKAEPEEIPLTILYEDDSFMVINKPVGMVVHPAPGHYQGTLVSAVLHHLNSSPPYKGGGGGRSSLGPLPNPLLCKEREQGLRPGIVHRLDKGTSGVMVVAKTETALRHLAGQFKNRTVEKVYQALVFGAFKQKKGSISLAIGRDSQHRRKFSSKTRYSREAVTEYALKKQWSGEGAGLSLLELRPKTGRTHQIRVHLSENHHPIVGDTLYGAKSYLSSIKNEELRQVLEQVQRPLLHAESLQIHHPETGKRLEFSAALPEDFQEVLKVIDS